MVAETIFDIKIIYFLLLDTATLPFWYPYFILIINLITAILIIDVSLMCIIKLTTNKVVNQGQDFSAVIKTGTALNHVPDSQEK